MGKKQHAGPGSTGLFGTAKRFIPIVGEASKMAYKAYNEYNQYAKTRQAQPPRQAQSTPAYRPPVVQPRAPYEKDVKHLPGPSGHYKGKFASPRKGSGITKNWDAQIKTEKGSVTSCSIQQTQYLGHGVSPYKMVSSVIYALIRKLFMKAGFHVNDFSAQISKVISSASGTPQDFYDLVFTYSWQITSNPNPLAAPTANAPNMRSFTYSCAGTNTFAQFAAALLIDMQTGITNPGQNAGLLRFNQFNLAGLSSTGGANNIHVSLASLPAESINLELDFVSNLKAQNRTLSASGSASTDVINANPLSGKLYRSPKWLNGFDLKSTSLNAQLSAQGMYTYYDTGIIETNSALTENHLLQKPPSPYVMGCTRASNVILQPSDIKYSHIKWKTTIGFNQFVQRFDKYFIYTVAEITNTPMRAPVGFSEVLALEPILHDRTSTTAIELGWQLDQVYSCKLSMKKSKLVPTIEVL